MTALVGISSSDLNTLRRQRNVLGAPRYLIVSYQEFREYCGLLETLVPSTVDLVGGDVPVSLQLTVCHGVSAALHIQEEIHVGWYQVHSTVQILVRCPTATG
jgi:hypothetical protein